MLVSCKVLAIAASPRRHGNSETLLDRALAGVTAADAGAAIEKIVLNECKVKPCQNCGYCEKNGVCRFAASDDMGGLYEKLEHCDRFIVASPIFFANVTAQLKIMFDRCQPYWVRKFLRRESLGAPARKALFLCLGGFEHDRFYKCARMVVKTWCICLDIELVADLFYAGIDKSGEIDKHPTALQDAFAAGSALVR